ncbi:unnamed protein product [Spirodela intermedia]|uniref:Uncharacterized protein n=1 Tax=Spirodela intermedia TaxID=51605 RepID=A0A7I8L8A8_SPIIN|nr:unnamed protein product [Spirodela intermedia]
MAAGVVEEGVEEGHGVGHVVAEELVVVAVVRCCLELAASVGKTFLPSDVVVVDIKEPGPVPVDNSGYGY